MSVTSSTSGTTSSSLSAYSSTIESLLAQDEAPLQNIQAQQAQLQVTQGVLSDLGTKMSTLKTALDLLRGTGSLSPLSVFTTSSGNTSVVQATATGAASRGSHQVTVSQLAQPHTLAGAGFQKSGTDFAAGTYSFKVTVAGVTTAVNVQIGAGLTNAQVLTNVAQAVNASGAAVNASVITTDATAGTQKLVLQSGSGGVANLISSVADSSGGLAAQLGVAGTSTSDTYSAATLQKPMDAKYTLDGIAMQSSSNAVSDALLGVTFTLGSTSDTPVTFSIASDTTSARKVIDDFITKYNDVVSSIRAHNSVSSDGKTFGELNGMTSFDSLLSDLRSTTYAAFPGAAPGAPKTLGDLGITIGRDGTLSVTDDTKLSGALNANPAQVVALFAGDSGIGGKLFTEIDNFTGTRGGLQLTNNQLSQQSTELTQQATEQQARIDARRTQLVNQFAQLQALASQLQAQQAQLGSLTSIYGYG